MKKLNLKLFVLVGLLTAMLSSDVYCQGAYTSLNNYTGNWETAGTWTKQHAWMANPPLGATVGGSFIANVYGYITRNGNLTFNGGSKLNVYDTLVVMGNFSVASSVEVHPGGVLIVIGNFTSTSSGGNKLINNGDVVVIGNFSHSGGNITTNDQVYVFGSHSFGWGANVDGIGYNGSNTATMGNELSTEQELADNNSALASFLVNGLGYTSAVLPITLTSFEANLSGKNVIIKWITSSEIDFDYFQIERSIDAENFEPIATVYGEGSMDSGHTYFIQDNTPLSGRSYYRLKAVDLDESFEYFGMQRIDNDVDKKIAVYPNPLRGEVLNVNANFEVNVAATVQITNNAGKILYQSESNSPMNALQIGSNIGRGIYIVRFIYQNQVYTQRLIIN